MKNVFLVVFGIILMASANVYSQDKSNALKYTVTYDDPYDIKKLFIHFQPIIGDIAALNVVGGFGLEANYYHSNLFDIEFSGRTSYGERFDISRDAAIRNSFNDNDPTPYYYAELGGTYHILDYTAASKSKILLYSKRLKGDEWAATVAKNALIDNTVRQIVGARVGGMFYSSVTDLNKTLTKQELTLYYDNGLEVESTDLYTNVLSYSVYLGGSMSWFKNFAVDFESRWEPNGDDLLLTTYLDLLYSPGITIDDLVIGGETVSLDEVKRSAFGFRAGLKGKFNRTLGWGYNVETGLRPGIAQNGFFLTFKLSFPIYGTKLEQTVEAVNTETGE
ncbi:MAG: hypothetical protein KDC79_04380 [Cyclobacteriaceae bacterium]|nr:hypothetical protein [Cyclobacteriaceae bacterium]